MALVTVSATARCGGVDAGDEWSDGEIIGGQFDRGDRAVVGLYTTDANDPSRGSICTGEVIAPTVVLTAGHCVESSRLARIGIHAPIFGVLTGSELDVGRRPLAVSKVITHPGYGPAGGPDVAVLILERRIAIRPLELNREPLSGTRSARAIGYGVAEDDRASRTALVKRMAEVTISEVSASTFNALGDAGESQCFGDSGGPVLIEIDGQEKIAGISSHTRDPNASCGLGNVNTRVDVFADFIDEQVSLAETHLPRTLRGR